MSVVETVRRAPSPSGAAANSRRRSFLSGLIGLPMLAAVVGAWWLRSSETVIIRGGWVLSKDD